MTPHALRIFFFHFNYHDFGANWNKKNEITVNENIKINSKVTV